jgi:hypothetical protein
VVDQVDIYRSAKCGHKPIRFRAASKAAAVCALAGIRAFGIAEI